MRVIFILLVAIPALLGASIQEQVEEKIAEYVKNSSWNMTKYQIPGHIKTDIETSAGQKFIKNFVYVWTINTPEGFYGYAIADAVKAKSAFITTMTLLNSEGMIVQLDVLDYKGEHGRAILDNQWLDQFQNKNYSSTFLLGDDIDAATGATYSSQAVSRGAKRCCLLAAFLLEKTGDSCR